MKPLRFIGTARKELAGFPKSVRRRAGYELFMLQVGRDARDFKSIPSVGQGAYELRLRDETRGFRVIYVAKFEHAIYVLHAFEKTTLKTPKTDIDLAARRYKLIRGIV